MAVTRNYKKAIKGGRFKWYYNVSDLDDPKNSGTEFGLTNGASINMGNDELREIEVDGQIGAVKGGLRVIDVRPEISLTLVQFETETLIRMLRMYQTNTGQIAQIRPKGMIEETQDYLTNLVGYGEAQDGTIMRVILDNPILKNNPEMDLANKEEVNPELVFMGTYESADSNVPPISINFKERPTPLGYSTSIETVIKESINQPFEILNSISDLVALQDAIKSKIQGELTFAVPAANLEVEITDGDVDTVQSLLNDTAGGTEYELKCSVTIIAANSGLYGVSNESVYQEPIKITKETP